MASLPQVGQVFDAKYRIDAILGSGGVATVFTAYQLEFDRMVALKLVHAHYADDEEFKARFVREAHVLARLHHDNIVLTYNMGISTNGFPYLAMELVKGDSLRKVLSELERFPAAQALKIIRDAALALAYVHEQGIVHRDLKPENILLAESPAPNTVKLIDFGLARIEAAGQQGLTATGELLGTTDYMSPEQCSGKKPDKRSDIYSLAICLYELMTGKKPFTADTPVGTMYKQLNVPMPALQPYEVDVFHPLFNELIQKGTAKKPDERFQSMDEFAAQLNEAIKKIDGMTVKMIKKSRRRRLSPLTLTTITLSLIALAIGVALVIQKRGKETKAAEVKVELNKRRVEQIPKLQATSTIGELRLCETWLKDNLESKAVQTNQLAKLYCDALQDHLLFSIPGTVPGRSQIMNRLREHLRDRHIRVNFEELFHTQLNLARALMLNGEKEQFEFIIKKIDSEEDDIQLRDAELHNELAAEATLMFQTGHLDLEEQLITRSSKIVAKRHDMVQLVPELCELIRANMLRGNESKAKSLAKEAADSLEICLQEKQPLDFTMLVLFGTMIAPYDERKKTANLIDNFFPDENAVLEKLKQTNPNVSAAQLEQGCIFLKLGLARCYRQEKNLARAKTLTDKNLEERMLKQPAPYYDPRVSSFFISELIQQKVGDLDERLKWHLDKIRKKGADEYLDFAWTALHLLPESDPFRTQLKKDIIQSFGLYESSNPSLCGEMRTKFGYMLLYSDQAAVAHEQFQRALRDLGKSPSGAPWLLPASYGLVRSSIEMHNYNAADEELKNINTKELLASANIKDASYDFCFRELQGRILFENGHPDEGLKVHEDLRNEYKSCSLAGMQNHDVFCQDLADEYLTKNQSKAALTVLKEGVQALLKYRLGHPGEQLRLIKFMEIVSRKRAEPEYLKMCKNFEQAALYQKQCLDP